MHRLSLPLIAAMSAVAFTQIASAADVPRKAPAAPPPPAPVYNWTGFYVGVNAGGAWSAGNTTTISSVPTFKSPFLTAFGESEFNNITAGGNGVLGHDSAGFI